MMKKGIENHGSVTSTNGDLKRLFLSLEGMFITLVAVIIGLLLPEDILSRFPVLEDFVRGVGSHFPQVVAYQRKSAFPEVAGLYFTTLLCITPLLLVYFIRDRDCYLPRMCAEFERRPFRFLFGVLFLMALSFWCLLDAYTRADGFSYKSAPIATSRLALTTVGFFFAGGSAWGSVASVFLVISAIFYKKSTRG